MCEFHMLVPIKPTQSIKGYVMCLENFTLDLQCSLVFNTIL